MAAFDRDAGSRLLRIIATRVSAICFTPGQGEIAASSGTTRSALSRPTFLLLSVLLLAMTVSAAARSGQATAEVQTAAYFERIADSPPKLRMFLQAMPKGADLHNHLGGSVYAEDYLYWADGDDLCIATDSYRIVQPPCNTLGRMPVRGLAESDYAHYSRAIDTLSVRGWENHVGDPTIAGYDRFFSTFDAFRAAAEGNVGKAIAVTREAAARDHVGYVELMVKPKAARALQQAVETKAGADDDFAALSSILSPLLPAVIEQARAEFDGYDTEIAAIEGCKTAQPAPACAVEVRYQIPARRNQSAARVFAEFALGFAMAEADPRFVGVNIAAPEHDPVSLRDYTLHMRMLAFLKRRHPAVPLSLHAGELTLGLVPPRDLHSHIRDAVEIAGAKRIGHGVDIAYEEEAPQLLRRMARDRVAVEINLSSNAAILGVKGRDHPLALYREAGVPVVLSTDDQGVLRSDMTNEYLRAVQEHRLRYLDLKQIARNGLEYAFVSGAGLWQSRVGGAIVAPCATSGASPSVACTQFLNANPKAQLQWRLEQDLAKFENGLYQ